MKLTIDKEVVEKNNLSMEDFLLLLIIANGGDVHKIISSLIERKWIQQGIFNKNQMLLSLAVKDTIQTIILDSAKTVEGKEDYYNSLANKLRDIYPKGVKPSTNYQWRGSTAEIAKKLKNLVVKYNCTFTEEEAIEATKAYIASFNGDYRYMKLLKYFLLKIPTNNNGDIEIDSEFMSYLENKGKAEESNNNWTTDLA